MRGDVTVCAETVSGKVSRSETIQRRKSVNEVSFALDYTDVLGGDGTFDVFDNA